MSESQLAPDRTQPDRPTGGPCGRPILRTPSANKQCDRKGRSCPAPRSLFTMHPSLWIGGSERREWEGLFRRRLRKEEFCQANFGADIVLEPACAGEVVKDIGRDRKIPSERKLELQVSPQEVIFT
jgi:hypothetical protein